MSGGTSVGMQGVYGVMGKAAAGDVSRLSARAAVGWTSSAAAIFGCLAGMERMRADRGCELKWCLGTVSPCEAKNGPGRRARRGTTCRPITTCIAGADLCSRGCHARRFPVDTIGAVSWTDRGGNFWLFGGLGCDASGTAGALNNLWEFNPQSMTWTWRTGSDSVGPARGGTGGPSGVYETKAPQLRRMYAGIVQCDGLD